MFSKQSSRRHLKTLMRTLLGRNFWYKKISYGTTGNVQACMIVFTFLWFSFFLGLNARYESKHPAVHVSSQPHGQGWSLWQPGGEDEEETAHDAALWPQHPRYVTCPTAFNISFLWLSSICKCSEAEAKVNPDKHCDDKKKTPPV